ncbi:hypothetical protein BpHYR1_010815 [Brachionus plicatilis]|uniref:Uncharacterized protein n=1 Tax=Brachionus plicatilis TaxID=10195 RepID=A0A3M7QG45_BRAPC|nr:hypothetical protein BpHYR1_010815 [Brachionus plicatilis]
MKQRADALNGTPFLNYCQLLLAINSLFVHASNSIICYPVFVAIQATSKNLQEFQNLYHTILV